MKVTTVKVNVGVTKNLGNYESLRIDYAVEAELEGEEKTADVLDRLRSNLAMKITDDLNHSNGGRDWLK